MTNESFLGMCARSTFSALKEHRDGGKKATVARKSF